MVSLLGTQVATGVLILVLSSIMLTILVMVPMIISLRPIALLYVGVAIGVYTTVCISAGSVMTALWEYKEDSARNVEGKMNH